MAYQAAKRAEITASLTSHGFQLLDLLHVMLCGPNSPAGRPFRSESDTLVHAPLAHTHTLTSRGNVRGAQRRMFRTLSYKP